MIESFSQFLSFIYNYRVLLFYGTIILLILLFRKKFDVQGGFIFLYRTKIGLKSMDFIAKRFNRTVRFLASIGIWAGYIGFIGITVLLFKLLVSLLQKPDTIGVSPVIPGVAIAGTGMVFPLVIGWLALLIIIVVHEFSHGIVARAYNLKILSSGFAFFGPLMGAFVEPDEKEISKQPEKIQNSIYAAGPFSNILLTGVSVLLLIFVLPFAIGNITTTEGIIIEPIANYSANNAGMAGEYTLLKINDIDVSDNITLFQDVLTEISPGDEVKLETKKDTFFFKTGKNPTNETKAYVGIYIRGMERVGTTDFYNYIYSILLWIYELLFWVAFISINIGLINLYPIYITDGARMLKIMLESRMKNKKKAQDYWVKINNLALFLLISIILIQIFNWVSTSLLI